MSYTINLIEPALPELARHQAESRYRQTLEAALGGPGGVLLTWSAWQHAEHVLGEELPEGLWRQARRWIVAAEKARVAALSDLDAVADACFELRTEW